MNNQSVEQLENAFAPIRESLLRSVRDESGLRDLGSEFAGLAVVAQANGKDDLFRGAQQMARLAEVAAMWTSRYPDDAVVVDEIMQFVDSQLGEFETRIGSDESNPKIDMMIEVANDAWADYFIMSEGSWGEELTTVDHPEHPEHQEIEDREPELASDDIAMLLQAVSGGASVSETAEPAREPVQSKESEAFAANITGDMAEANRLAREELQADREMLDAYLDDSWRCVAAMEAAALSIDATPDDGDSIRAFCRELHTLKGASATVGLAELASYLHQVENSLEETFASGTSANPEMLFETIDSIRSEMEKLKPQEKTTQTANPQPDRSEQTDSPSSVAASWTPSAEISSFASSDDSSIRVRAAHLDRLMDMLAELVVLRNRRESNASEFDMLYGELSRCSTRLSIAEEQTGNFANASVVGEVSKDIEAVARGFRTLQKPVAKDNSAITRFIRDFRQELMQLRRVPISDLFSRMQRAARDAAKKENKNVRLNVIGESTGLEQEIQERLYESLLHVVRNSVSHGIQSPADRAAAGKDETGTIVLEASASAQLLVIEVRDDGSGLDYEAVRKRGIEKGLIAPNYQASKGELANLIFHAGFSTKESATEISGRGVGMDVLASTLEQMHGRIEVESESGQGTTIRLLIPRRTGIEHVMVFRCQEQLYALPMQSIVAAKKTRDGFENVMRLGFSPSDVKNEAKNVLVLKRSRTTNESTQSQFAVAVDELLGPEEVVVRGLPLMLRNHPLFCGMTLSGSGEKVLLLESDNFADYCLPESGQGQGDVAADLDSNGLRALVVDDSITARKHASKLLKANGFATVEAGDGLEAIELLHRSKFDLVVTDLDMPRLGGLELLADIKNGKYCNAPVLVVSSRGDESFVQQAISSGAAGYINKPVSKMRFQKQLEQLGLILATSKG